LEVKEMIWAKSVPDRVVTITQIADKHPPYPAIAYTPYLPHFKISAIKVPVLLHINQESRRVGLKIYHIVYKCHYKNVFYFNPSADSYPRRQKLLSCKSGTPSDTTTWTGRSVKTWSR
jgi:hypothetical protein